MCGLFLFLSGALGLSPSDTARPAPDTPPDTTVVRSTYAVEVDYPNFFFWLGAQLFGHEPDTLVYEETWIGTDSSRKWSRATLVADGAEEWFSVAADTTARSFTDLPGERFLELNAGTRRFVSNLLSFFKSGADTLFIRSFAHGGALVRAVVRQETPCRPATGTPQLLEERGRCFSITTERLDPSPEPYVSGTLIVGRRGGQVAYPLITVRLHDSGVSLSLSLQRFSVRSSRAIETPRP
ncbi:MAG: hypothetical protein AAB601_01175 [Patescibacteria group bacterium]